MDHFQAKLMFTTAVLPGTHWLNPWARQPAPGRCCGGGGFLPLPADRAQLGPEAEEAQVQLFLGLGQVSTGPRLAEQEAEPPLRAPLWEEQGPF